MVTSLHDCNMGDCCFPNQSQINALTLWLNACSRKLKWNNDLHASPLMLVYPWALTMFNLPGKHCGFTLPSCRRVCVGSDVWMAFHTQYLNDTLTFMLIPLICSTNEHTCMLGINQFLSGSNQTWIYSVLHLTHQLKVPFQLYLYLL